MSQNITIARNTFFLYIRMLLIMAVSLYTSRVVLATLGVDDFGIYNVVGGIVTMFAFLNGTFSGVTQRYLTYELGKGQIVNVKRVFNTAMCIHWFIAILILILAETIGLWFLFNKLNIPETRMNAAFWVFQFSVLSTVVFIISVPYNACIVAHEKMSAFAFISVIEVLLKLFVVFLLKIFGYDKLIVYAMLIFIVQLVIRIVYTKYCVRKFEESRYSLCLDMNLARSMIGFTGWSLFGGFASVGLNQGINILLNVFFGPVVNSARAIAVQVDSAVQSFVTNFQMALNPQIVKNYAKGNIEQLHKLLYLSCKYSYYLFFVLTLPIFIEMDTILNLWLIRVPDHAQSFTRLTLLILLIECMSKPIMTATNATGIIKKYQMVVGSLLLLVLPLSYALLHFYNVPELVFIVHFILTFISLFVRLDIVKGLLEISLSNYFNRVIKPVLLVTISSVSFPYFIYIWLDQCLFRFTMVIFVSILSSVIAIYYLGTSSSEKIMVRGLLKKIFYRK